MTSFQAIHSAVVVGGSGAVGALLVERLAVAGVPAIHVIDRCSPGAQPHVDWIQDDICHPLDQTLQLIESADLVVLATPEAVAIAGLGAFLARMRPGSLLVDTLSVKSRFAQALQGTDTEVELLGINPMFAPSLGFAGRSVVAVPYATGERAEAFLEFIRAQGSDVVSLSAEEHDRACAALQVATHAAVLSFGIALRAANYELAAAARIAPPPHRTMLALLARIVSGDPEVYRDIQVANPFAAGMRVQLAAAQRRLDEVVSEGSAESFDRLIVDLRSIFADADVDYAQLCAQLFAVNPRTQ